MKGFRQVMNICAHLFAILVEKRNETLSGGLERIRSHQTSHVEVNGVQLASLRTT